jgi:hypothetical protein
VPVWLIVDVCQRPDLVAARSTLHATLAVMEAPWWFLVLGYAELIFVVSFFLNEVAHSIFRGSIIRVERAMHAIPHDRYYTRFALPLIAAITAACIGIGINLMTGNEGLRGYVGLLLIIVFLFLLGRYLLSDATGSLPRPIPRARLRRLLAEAGERLDSAESLTASETVRLIDQLTRIGKVGDRLARRANEESWWKTIRNERRWLVISISLAILLPLAGIIRITVHLATSDSNTAASSALGLFVLAAAAAAGAFLRRMRHRRNLSELGVELRAESDALLARVAEATAIQAQQSSSRPTPTLRNIWDRLIRRWPA